MHFIIKKGPSDEVRVDHPSRHPDWEISQAAAKRRIANGELKFESEGERRDYERQIASNPNNIYGLPAFYPPERLVSRPTAMSDRPLTVTEERKIIKELVKQSETKDIQLFCEQCNKVTRHIISTEDGWCSHCATFVKWRLPRN